MKLVLFKGQNGQPVAVNPDYIVSVEVDQLDTVVIFTTLRGIAVTEDFQNVISKIDSALD